MKVSINNLSFNFEEREIFKGISFEINPSSALPVVILGPSGCGKTTLLRLIAGLLKPEKGEVVFEETGASPPALISCVFQEPRLLPHLNILENTALPLEKIYGKEQAARLAREALKSVLLEERSFALPVELSGGQKQRTALARAFAYPSEVLLMDEPFQSLDIPLRLSLMDLTLSLLAEKKRLALVITHDPREAVYLGSRIIVLGPPPLGIVFDEDVNLSPQNKTYGSVVAEKLETKLIKALGN